MQKGVQRVSTVQVRVWPSTTKESPSASTVPSYFPWMVSFSEKSTKLQPFQTFIRKIIAASINHIDGIGQYLSDYIDLFDPLCTRTGIEW